MSKKKSLRVYFVTHHDGRLTGRLLRTWESFFDEPAPAAYGATEAEVLGQLEERLRHIEATSAEPLSRYLWDESLEVRPISVPIHPQTVQKKRPVIGKKKILLRLSFAWSRTASGAFRVLVPRFGWNFILEDLDSAPAVLQNAVSSVLLGAKPRWIYDFRHEGPEYVRDWAPELLQRLDETPPEEDEDRSRFPALNAVAEELVERAARGKLPPTLELEDALESLMPLLLRRPPTSLLLVGGPGVGKTSLVLRLARRLAQLRRKDKDRVPRLWRTSAHRILAGMVYLGQWQERCLHLIRELSGENDLLYLDRLVPALQPQPDGSSIAELLLPALAAEELSLIAECTEGELERAQRRFPAFVGRFRLVRLAETPASRMPALLERAQAQKGGARIHPQALRLLVRYLQSFQRDLLFPGKGFRFLDWLQREGARPEGSTLYPSDLAAAYSRWSGLPLELISDEHAAGVEQLAARLGRFVIGQDAACTGSARVLARFKAGLNDPEKPVGSLLFVGPTGVGKTELAKALTRVLFGSEERMVRLDMSEYMLSGSAQRLLEAAPGGTSFAERLRQQPLSLVLLDEIEKAHAEVYDLLLGLLGEGRLTDSMGRLVDLRAALVVMTSNLGSGEAAASGFGEAAGRLDPLRRVREHFRPEFVGRLDQVVVFRPLAFEDIERIVELELAKAGARTGLVRRGMRLVVEPEARRWLAREGTSPDLGARPLKRLIEEKLVTPAAVRLAADPGLRGRELRFVLKDGAVVLASDE
jgi:ATP-dependent Clp protease ATP-binding subunit ClpC